MQAQRSRSLSDLNLYLVIFAHLALFAGLSLAAPLIRPELPLALKLWTAFLGTGIATWTAVLTASVLVKSARAIGLCDDAAGLQIEDAQASVPTPAAMHAATAIRADKQRSAELISSAA